MCLSGVVASLIFLAHEVPPTSEPMSATNSMMLHPVSIDTLDSSMSEWGCCVTGLSLHEIPATSELASVTSVMMSHLVSTDMYDFSCV